MKRLWKSTIAFFLDPPLLRRGNSNPYERRKTMIKKAIGKLVHKEDLEEGEMGEAMMEIVTRSASIGQIASFVTALRMKGETTKEITAAARIIQERVSRIHGGEDTVCLDREEITVERETILKTTKGLKGGTNIFNISTATAFVVAGGGLKVAKHGRKSLFPLCGCADVIEALGVNLDMTPTQLERCLKEINICFIYQPFVQNGLEQVINIREKIGIRSIFNLLDPLINPAKAKIQILGVYEASLTEMMAVVLRGLGIKKGLVFYGEDTLDEISITGKTKLTELNDGDIKSYFIQPEDFGIKKRKLVEIRGGTKEQNADIILEVLKGRVGAQRDVTVLNAAAAFMIAGRANDFNEGIELANQSIDTGKALRTLENLVEFTKTEHRFLRDHRYELEMG
jgi:anthranilate phosphoribosyltransferase